MKPSTQTLILPPSSVTMASSMPQPLPSLKSSALPLPVLVVGTKLDQVRSSTYSSTSYLPPWSNGSRSASPILLGSKAKGFAASRAFPEINLVSCTYLLRSPKLRRKHGSIQGARVANFSGDGMLDDANRALYFSRKSWHLCTFKSDFRFSSYFSLLFSHFHCNERHQVPTSNHLWSSV